MEMLEIIQINRR